ncbi:MAG: FadR family transcriptional regulator [Alicyclobacillus sp.]|nr:FadR family transcriptional regulator [Alicyclobacillus sp.]
MQSGKLSRQLLHALGREIVGGELKSGDVLPTVEALSEQKGVSRTVTREALKGLSALGLVKSQPKVGTVVRERSEWQWWNPDVLRWSIDAEDSEFLVQLVEVRRVIEPAAVALAAKNANEEDFVELRAALKQLRASLDNDEAWAAADYALHDRIIAAAHNELMLHLVRVLRDALMYSRQRTISVLRHESGQPSNDAFALHAAVVDAICQRNEIVAYQRMVDLLQSVRELIEKSRERGEG